MEVTASHRLPSPVSKAWREEGELKATHTEVQGLGLHDLLAA